MSRTKAFLAYLLENAPSYAPKVIGVHAMDPQGFTELAEPMLEWASVALGEDAYLDRLTNGYVAFVSEVNMAQMVYEQTGHYENASFEDVYKVAYGDPEFMSDYHWGVYVTTFAWEHHLALYRFFRNDFLSKLEDNARIVDLGAGSGIYNLLAMHARKNLRVTAVDISPTSTEEAREMAKKLGFGDRAEHVCADATTWKPPVDCDAGISCFLMEHLEKPELLIGNLAKAVKPRGYVYVTTALTAAEVDHIYEFRRESEVLRVCEEAGFRVVSTHSLTPHNPPQDRHFLPRSMGLLLNRRAGDIW
jgi:2-polyprenyl-3-methyl-5-hydroxy-6-metoxy-1,4-benzoquinol methylase